MNKKERKEYLKNLPGIRGDELPEDEQAMFFDDHVDSNERRKNIIITVRIRVTACFLSSFYFLRISK